MIDYNNAKVPYLGAACFRSLSRRDEIRLDEKGVTNTWFKEHGADM